jgi:CheY-like chemotaxis protein
MSTTINCQNLTVLIVEDEQITAQALGRGLQMRGLTSVLFAANGKIALEVIKAFDGKIELIITDGWMPEMTGTQLIVELRQQNFAGQIIAVTGDGTSEIGFNDLGVNLLLKPYRLDQMVQLINKLCSSQ